MAKLPPSAIVWPEIAVTTGASLTGVTVKVAVDYAGSSYPLRISRGGTTYGIILVDPTDPSASKLRINTPAGVKALKKM